METLLVFLAIAAIQMLAAYSKQKKEAAKRASRPIPPPYREEPEFEFEPDPDPEPELKPEPEPEPVLEIKPPPPKPMPVARRTLSPAAQGFVWATILQEPRYKVKWKQR